MLSRCPRAWLPLLGVLLAGCPEPPASFQKVDAKAAHELLAEGRAELLTVVEGDEAAPPGGRVQWRLEAGVPVKLESAPSDLPSGGLLVVASDTELGMRLAAALARPGDREVWLFIPASAEERQSIYVVHSPTQETPLGADS
jgi:hypothetical protein